MNNTKSIFRSKLFYLGLLNIVVGILTYLQGAVSGGTAITLNGILVVILRILTNEGVYLKKPTE